MKKTLMVLSLLAFSLGSLRAQVSVPAKLVWDPPLNSTLSFIVYERTATVPATVWTVIGVVAAEQPTLFPIVLDGLPHTYAVAAWNGFFESAKVSAIAPETPPSPTGLILIRVP
jgi:hypothetical protein